MQLIRSIHNLTSQFDRCALTIGNFDGVHLGHQAVLRHLREKAKALNLPTVVMLFEPQPREYFMGDKAPARLMRLRDKLHYLAKEGVDYVICVKFNRTFAALKADEFIQLLVQRLKVKFLSLGDDFRFGANRHGNFHVLRQMGQQFGFQVEKNSSFNCGDVRVSSTAIREALAQDNLTLAEQLLGKAYSISGRVAHGNKLGRTIGFPTANILLQRRINPIHGVYAVKVKLSHYDNGTFYDGVANIGRRPTINGVKQLLEVHIFDFQQDIYSYPLEVVPCYKIRNEIKFPSFDALKIQIQQDVKDAKQYFAAANRKK